MTKKRILAMLLCVLMVFSLLPVGVMAEEAIVEEEPIEQPAEEVLQVVEEETLETEENEVVEEVVSGDTNPTEINEGPTTPTVFQVGTQAEFETALTSFLDGDEIKLKDDIALTARLALTELTADTAKSLTINLNGYNITYSATNRGFILVRGYNTVSIIGSGTVNVGTSKNYFSVNENATLNVSGGTYAGTNAEGIVYGSGTLSIAGGTFGFNPEAYVPATHKVAEDKDAGTWTVSVKTEEDPDILEIGTVKYKSLAAAADVATATDTIKVISNFTITASVDLKAGTLDLNGKTITAKAAKSINVTGTATITDGATGGKIVYGGEDLAANTGILYVANGGNLTLAGGTVSGAKNTSNGGAVYIYSKSGTATFNMTGGTIENCTGVKGLAIYGATGSVVNVSGGTINAAEGSTQSVIEVYAGTTSISGGTINGKINKGTSGTLNITGGTYSIKPDKIVDGYEFQADDQEAGPWTVVKSEIQAPSVAKIGETGYPTLTAALAEATASDTITLVDNITIDATINLTKGTLDLNGKTITANVAKSINVTGTATITDGATGGKIVYGGEDLAAATGVLYVANGGNLTLAGGTVSGANNTANGGAVYVYSKSGTATFNMTGGTIENCTGVKGLAIYCATGSVVNISGGTINAAEGATQSVIEAYNGTTTISGGTINGKINKGTSGTLNITGGFFSELNTDYVSGDYKRIKVTDTANAAAPYTVTNQKGSLVYDVNGGEEETAPETKEVYYLPGYTVEVKIATATPTGTGNNVFKNWNTAVDGEGVGTGTEYDSGATIPFAPNASGTMTLFAIYEEVTTPVAKIGETTYVSLAQAIQAAEANETTIILLDNVNEQIAIAEGQKITIDLGSFNITGVGIGSAINNKGELTLNGTGTVSGIAQTSGGGIDNSGKLVINGVTVTGTISEDGKASGKGGGIYNTGNVIINSGTINGSAKSGGAIYNAEGGNLTINGGTISGSFQEGTTGGLGNTIYSRDDTIINGGTVDGDIYLGSYTTTVATISGGELNGNITVGSKATLNVTGGKFASFNPADYLPGNCEVGEEAPYSVVYYVARIEGTRYLTLAEAVAAAAEGDTVVLLANVTEDVTMGVPMNIESKGFTITGTVSVTNGLLYKETEAGWAALTPYYSVTKDEVTTQYATFAEAAEAAGGVYVITALVDDVPFETYRLKIGETVQFCGAGIEFVCPEGIFFTDFLYDEENELFIEIYSCCPELVAKVTASVAYVGGEAVEVSAYEDMGDGNLVPVAADMLDWTVISGDSYVTFTEENPNVFTAAKAGGTVTVKGVLKNDAAGRGVSVSFTTAAQAMDYYIVNAADDTRVTEITEEYTGTAIKYILKPAGDDVDSKLVAKTTAVSSDSTIAAVKALKDGTWQITLSAAKANTGSCTVTFTPYVKSGKKLVAQTPYVIDVNYIDYIPGMQSKVTINSYNCYVSSLPVVERSGNAIVSARLLGSDKKNNPVEKELPVAACYDAEFGTLYIWAEKTFTGTLKTFVRFTTEKGEKDVALSITAKNAKTKITIKQLNKLETYDVNSEAVFGINVSNFITEDNITVILPAGYAFADEDNPIAEDPEYVYDYLVTLKRVPGAAKYGTSVTVKGTFNNYFEGVNTVSAKASIGTFSKAALSLTPATSTVKIDDNAYVDASFSTAVYNKNTGEVMKLESDDITVITAGYSIPIIFNDGSFVVEADEPKVGTNTISIKVQPEGWTSAVTLKYIFKIQDTNPTVKLSSSTLTLNAKVPGSFAETGYTVSQNNFEISNIICEPAAGNTLDETALKVSKTDDFFMEGIKAELVGEVPAGSYKYNVSFVDRYGNSFKTLPLVVKVISKTVTITAKAVKSIQIGNDLILTKGLDLTKRYSMAGYAIALSNVSKDMMLDGTDLSLLNYSDKSENSDFELQCIEVNGKAFFGLMLRDGIEYKSAYNLIVKGSVNGVDVYSGKIVVKVANSKLKMLVDNSSATLYQSAAKSGKTLVYTMSVNDPDYDGIEIGSVSIGNVAGVFRKSLADTGADIRWNVSSDRRYLTVYVTVDNTCRIARNKTYTLPIVITPNGMGTDTLDAKAATTVNLTLKVLK